MQNEGRKKKRKKEPKKNQKNSTHKLLNKTGMLIKPKRMRIIEEMELQLFSYRVI